MSHMCVSPSVASLGGKWLAGCLRRNPELQMDSFELHLSKNTNYTSSRTHHWNCRWSYKGWCRWATLAQAWKWLLCDGGAGFYRLEMFDRPDWGWLWRQSRSLCTSKESQTRRFWMSDTWVCVSMLWFIAAEGVLEYPHILFIQSDISQKGSCADIWKHKRKRIH